MRSVHCSVRPLLSACTLTGALFFARDVLAAGVLPAEASAEQKKEATDHFAAGKRAIEAKNWERAALELRASLAVVDSPNARLELARTLRDSDRLGDAWVEYGHVIESATKLAAMEERYARTADAATAERGEVEAKLAFVTVTVTAAPVGATLKIGGRVVPSDQWAAPAVAPAGAVDVVLADSTGKELARQTANAVVGQRTPVALDATPPAVAPAPSGPHALDTGDDDKPTGADQPNSAPDVEPRSDKAKLRPYAYVAAGVGAAGLVSFGIFGLLANSTYSDLKSACPSASGGCPPGKQGEISSGQTQQTIANVSLVVGLVGVATGVTLFVLSIPSKTPSASTALVVGPGYLGLKGSL